MQLRLKPRNNNSLISRGFIVKTVLAVLFFSITIFVIDKINFAKPTKFIKKEISNDKLITLK